MEWFLVRRESIHQVLGLIPVVALQRATVLVFCGNNVQILLFMLGFGALVDFEGFLSFEFNFFDQTFATEIADLLPTLSKLLLAL